MSLFATLRSVSGTLNAYERGLTISQNNVANASTPGYSRQVQSLQALPFDLRQGRAGGVESGQILNSRSSFAERNVWREQHLNAQYGTRRDHLSALEPVFTIAEGAGVPDALNGFFEAFSQLTVSPNNTVLRETALERSRAVAQRFGEAAAGLAEAARNTGSEITDSARQINALASRITEINIARRNNYEARNEPGSDAALHDSLEQLAQISDFTALEHPDGTISVHLGGQSLLVAGDRSYPVSADLSGGGALIRDAVGNDITGRIRSGKLGALLEFRNNLVPAYQSQLDTLAISFAGQVNAQLAAGLDQNGLTPATDLFVFTGPPGANTLAISNLPASGLALALSPTPGGNGNAIHLAELGEAITVSGLTFRDFYAQTASSIGRALRAASQSADSHQLLLTQARSLRSDISGVSLDEEAAKLIEFQRAYQAAAQMFKIVDEMTQTLLNLRS